MSFSHIRTPQKPTQPDEAAKFKFNGIVSEDTRIVFTHNGKKLTAKISDMAKVEDLLLKEKFGQGVKRPAEAIWKANTFLFNRADQQVGSRSPKIDQETGEFYEGYNEDTYFFAANSDQGDAPLVIDQKCRALPATSGHPENGDFVNCIIDAYAFEYQGKKGLSGTIKGVQYLREGDKFGAARGIDSSAFDEEELEEELEEMDGDDAFGPADDDAGFEEEEDGDVF